MRRIDSARAAALACAALLSAASARANPPPPTQQPATATPPASESTTAQPPAKTLFGRQRTPAPLAARAIGFYSRGCLAGGVALPIDGPAWQAMRLSRNRNWGHPNLVALVERLANDAKAQDGWSGLLVGDLAQPRGGPMLTGHASHQIGLDADIWLTPMPDKRLSAKEREQMSAVSMLADQTHVDARVFTDAHVRLIKRAAGYRDVERVLVHPAIKKALCDAAGSDRRWLGKVRPYWGHHYHMHIRISCPPDSPACRPQAVPSGDDGCGKEIDDWFELLTRPPKPAPKTAKPRKPKPPLTLADLPAECRTVLIAGAESAAPVPRPTPAQRPSTAKAP